MSGMLKIHIDLGRQVLALLNKARFTLKLKKFFFITNKVDYHEHLFPLRCSEIAAHSDDAIQELNQSGLIT